MSEERAFGDAAQLLARRVGLRLDPSARRRLARCVADEAAELGVDVANYVAMLEGDADAVQKLLNRVTVQETAFFRDPVQFEALARDVLPTLQEPFTIWSAGSANGQEPYSLAMVLHEAGLFDARVLTTDISTRALERTRAGVYSEREIGGLSRLRLDRYLVETERGYSITADLRSRVDIAHHNLVGPVPALTSGRCPVVFCRNVLIYFSHDEVVAFLNRVADLLPVGGWLFLGYSESLWQVTDRFELVRLGNAFVYRRTADRPESPSEAVPVRLRPAARARAVKRRSEPRPARAASPRPPRAEASATAAKRVASAASVSTPEPAPGADDRLADLIAAGEAALAAGDADAAVTTFRKCAYLDPDQPAAHLHLGLALEAAGDIPAARRAFSIARAALDACDDSVVEAVLDGYPVGELVRLLDRKLVEMP